MGRRIGALVLATAGVVVLATPVGATNEQPRITPPWKVKAGTMGAVLYGDCVDEKVKIVTSEGFVGGEARIADYKNLWKAEADIVDKPGTYFAHMKCDGKLGRGAYFTVVP
ncbi:hypothetical protein [Kibdelosporangium aridum]|uniref:hypothetical protein n=1 Tax=Kibdelosporangium aridum TaxID=2030 RepID=UPI00117A032A|nr:hypothetical protein [Kibdelosporangium aridum]